MSFDRQKLIETIAQNGPVARVIVADVAGSTPREVGASMLVWSEGQSGTIGGGRLEFDAAETARDTLARKADRVDRLPLGPALGQCCGGAVTLLTEIWDEARVAEHTDRIVARPMPGQTDDMPLSVRRILNEARSMRTSVVPMATAGWYLEPVTQPSRPIWIYGAGHVGRAIVSVLSGLPDVALTWIDTADGRFPDTIPNSVTKLVAKNPSAVVRFAPAEAEHLILTYSHAMDLDLCHALLRHNFRTAGVIGSRTKWTRFRSRLRQLGHSDAQISRIVCPIGDPHLGKHPQAIAVGVAAALLSSSGMKAAAKDATG